MQVFDGIAGKVVEVNREVVEQRTPLTDEQVATASPETLRYRIACLRAQASVPARSSSLQACPAKQRRRIYAEVERIQATINREVAK